MVKKDQEVFSLDDIAAKESVKVAYKSDIFEKTLELQNKIIEYRFKAIDMDDYLESQTEANESVDELMIGVLSLSLIHDNTDEFYTREEIIKGIPKQWRIQIATEILSESGISIDPKIIGF